MPKRAQQMKKKDSPEEVTGKRKRKQQVGRKKPGVADGADNPFGSPDGEEDQNFLVDVERVEEPIDEHGVAEDVVLKETLAEIPGRSRREKEKNAFTALAALLPLSPPIRDQLDKTGILRVSIAFLQLHKLMIGLMKGNWKELPGDEERTTQGNREDRQLRRKWAGDEHRQQQNIAGILAQFAFNLFQALDGFAIVLNSQGHVVYVSETVAVHLGISQIELVGNSLTDFLHPEDVPLLRDNLALFVDWRQLRVLGPELRFVLRFRCAPGRKPMLTAAGSAGVRGGVPAFKAIHFTGTLWPDNAGRFMGYGQPLVVYGQTELRMSASMFMFRSTLSLELIFVDTRFVSISEFQPNSLVDHCLYAFVHPGDVAELAEMHQTALTQSQSHGGPIRLIAATGGYFWVHLRVCLVNSTRLSCASLVQMLVGVCSLISGVEKQDVIMDSAQNGQRCVEEGGHQQQKQEEGNQQAGLLGYYSNKYYGGTAQQQNASGEG